MRIDWVPYSAAALVLGATALSVGALILPSGNEAATTLQMAETDGGRWLAVAVLYFLAAVTLTLGMPSILTLFQVRTTKFGMTAIGVFTIGCIGLAGFSMLLVFFRALAVNQAIEAGAIEEVSSEVGLSVFLLGWIGAFYLGELLLAIALLRAGNTPRWIPGMLLLHVALFPLSSFLPAEVQPMTALLVTVALCGVGITANQNSAKVAVPL
jgi:uncharacterized membrane protein